MTSGSCTEHFLTLVHSYTKGPLAIAPDGQAVRTASQGHEMYCYDLEATSLNPSQGCVILLSKLYFNQKHTYFTGLFSVLISHLI